MKKLLYILPFLLFPTLHLFSQLSIRADSTDCDNSFNVNWVKTAGDINDDRINGIATDNNGNIIIVGYFNGNMDFQSELVNSAGGTDFFIAKLDPNGNLIWIRTGGADQDDYASAVAVDNDGRINIIGNFRGLMNFNGININSYGQRDIFIIQYSPDGDVIWDEFLGGYNDDIAKDIATDSENNVLITGTYNQYLGIGNGTMIGIGENDFFAAKYKQDGTYLWRINDGSTLDDSGAGVACDHLGNVFVCGEFAGTIDFGTATLTAVGAKDIFLAKYNSNGIFQWAKKSGTGDDNDKAGAVSSDNFGNAYIYYKNDQASDMARVDKYNSNGALLFSIEFGGSGIITPKDITVDNAQNIYVSGMYSGLTNFGDGDVNVVGGQDYFVAKFNYNGTLKFKDVAGSIYDDCANAICLDNQNSLLAGGFCNNEILFGTNSYTAVGKEDILVVKYENIFNFGEFITSSIGCDPNNMCVDATIIGGTSPFTYYWNGAEATEDICGLSTGNHHIIVVDDNNCFIETIIQLIPPVSPAIPLPANKLICPFGTEILDAGEGNYSYYWSTEETTQTIEINDAGQFLVTVTDIENGCSSTASINITKRSIPNLLPDTDSLCSGDELTITTLHPYTYYLWSNGTANQNFTSGQIGNHWVRVFEYSTQCYYYDTILFVQYQKPNINIGNDVVICDGDSILISVLSSETNIVNYEWDNGSSDISIWATEAGIISLTITDENNCSAYDIINVGYDISPIVNLGEDFAICTNSSVVLDPDAIGEGLLYLWNDNSTNSTLTTSSSGTYWVKVSGLSGCAAFDTISIIIYNQPVLNLGADIEFCNNSTELIEISDSYASYQWSNGANTASLLVSQTEILSVTVTDTNGCIAIDTINIFEHELLHPFIGYDTVLCTGDTYILYTDEEFFSYNWHNGSTSPNFSVTQPGLYAVTVADNIGCSAATQININYKEGPILVSASTGGGMISVNATGGTPPLIYSHDGDTWQLSNIFTGLESDTYTISIMDKNYCMITTVVFLDQSIDVPNFFTPNGDGYNDWWVITGLYHFPEAEVQIFDRYGKKLYVFAGSDFGWDGTYAGYPLPSDTYWYTITLGQEIAPLRGNVTIKR